MGSLKNTKKRLLVVAGIVCTGLGIVGIFVPILPTTPFLLLAAACFMHGSDRLYHWLLYNRFIGTYIRNYIEGNGISLRVKIGTIVLLWITILLSAFLWVDPLVWKIVLLIVAVGVTLHLCRIKTC